jgi:hypothetical protein
VRWHDRSNSEDRVVDQPTQSKNLLMEARSKNAMFGSNKSTASISSHSTVQTSNKATKASDARQLVLAKARTSTIDPQCSKKSSSRAKIPEEMAKESEHQSQCKIPSSEYMCVRDQGWRSGVEKSNIGPSSGQGRGASTEEQMGRVSSKSSDPTSRRSDYGKSQTFNPTCEESKEKSSNSKSLASSKSELLRSTKVSEKQSIGRRSAGDATAVKKCSRHSTGKTGAAFNASRSDSGGKKSHPRNDHDTSKKLLGPIKKQKTDHPAVKASRPRISKHAHKSDKSNSESTKNKLDIAVPSNGHRTQERDKGSAKAKDADKSAPTEATKRTKHSTSTSHSTDSSRPPKPTHTTQSTGIPSQEIPRGRRRWPKTQAVTKRGKMPRMEKFVDDFNFSFE